MTDLEKAVAVVSRLFAERWQIMYSTGFKELAQLNNGSLRYASSRDMATILRICIPIAAELAAEARGSVEWRTAVAEVVGKYVACLTSRDLRADALHDGLAPFLEGSHQAAEAFTTFSALLSTVVLVYVVVMPNLADSFPDSFPDMADRAVGAVTRVSLFCTDLPTNPVLRWFALRKRRAQMRRYLLDGSLPRSQWVADLSGGVSVKFIRGVIQAMQGSGAVTIEQEQGAIPPTT